MYGKWRVCATLLGLMEHMMKGERLKVGSPLGPTTYPFCKGQYPQSGES